MALGGKEIEKSAANVRNGGGDCSLGVFLAALSWALIIEVDFWRACLIFLLDF